MKAAQIKEYGGVNNIDIVDIPKPIPTKGQVLVEVHASSLNPIDTVVREGNARQMADIPLPATLGGDIAGVVLEVGEGVTNVAVGDKVYGQASPLAGNSGAFAEYAATAASQVAKLPNVLDFNQAAALPLVAISALQAISAEIKLKSGQKIFIHGGAGGIGSIAIQIAKQLGTYVATTATGDNISLVEKLGADQIIDYKTQDFSEQLSGYDAVLDTVGGEDFNKSLKVLKRGGVAVSLAGQADETLASELGVTATTQATRVNTDILNELSNLVNSGAVSPLVDKVFPLDQIKEAFTARESGSVKGKIVIQIL